MPHTINTTYLERKAYTINAFVRIQKYYKREVLTLFFGMGQDNRKGPIGNKEITALY